MTDRRNAPSPAYSRLATWLRQRKSITCGVTLCAAILLSRTLPADDTDALDRELLESLEGEQTLQESLDQIVPRLLEGTQTAAKRLVDGQLDQQTTRLQQQILDDIDALLASSAPPNPPQNPPPPGSQDQQQSQDSQASDQQQSSADQPQGSQSDGQSDPSATSKESQQRTTPQGAGEAERERRLGLSTAAWGHLPPKLREQMRSAFSEEYIPEYDALVRRYYEALARRRASRDD